MYLLFGTIRTSVNYYETELHWAITMAQSIPLSSFGQWLITRVLLFIIISFPLLSCIPNSWKKNIMINDYNKCSTHVYYHSLLMAIQTCQTLAFGPHPPFPVHHVRPVLPQCLGALLVEDSVSPPLTQTLTLSILIHLQEQHLQSVPTSQQLDWYTAWK